LRETLQEQWKEKDEVRRASERWSWVCTMYVIALKFHLWIVLGSLFV